MITDSVFVSGATGYVAGELIVQLLKRGYAVTASVRSEASKKRCAHLEALAAVLPGTLQLVAADLLELGAYDQHVRGKKYVFHLASPVVPDGKTDDPQKDIVDPALKGTESIMSSVAKAGDVKRVVLTSSLAAVESLASNQPPKNGKFWTEEDWCHGATVDNDPYSASKYEAEMLAWQMSKEHKISLVVICPSLVMGAPLSKEVVAWSIKGMKSVLEGTGDLQAPDLVDVHDVALAHILAAELPQAQGRYILSLEDFTTPQDVVAMMEKEFGKQYTFKAHKPQDGAKFCSNAKAVKELGMSMTPASLFLPSMARAMLAMDMATLQQRSNGST